MAIYGGSLLRFLLEDFGYALDEGLILVADNDLQVKRFADKYCRQTQNGGKIIASWKKRRNYPYNYCCGFMIMKKSISEDEAVEFLSEKNFLPVIICGGLFPEYLQCNHYIFRLREADIEYIMSQNFADEMLDFFSFVTDNVTEICCELRRLENSIAVTEYAGAEEYRHIYNFFISVSIIYGAYLRVNQTERVVHDFFETYKNETMEQIKRIQEFGSGIILSEMITSLVWQYLDSAKDVILVDLEKLDAKADTAIRREKAIVFDKKFYYFPPRLFMKICESLLCTTSETDLKRKLRAEEIIYCNSADFTVKKSIYNVYGVSERKRFIWVYKDALLSPDNLCLEDIFLQESEEKFI